MMMMVMMTYRGNAEKIYGIGGAKWVGGVREGVCAVATSPECLYFLV